MMFWDGGGHWVFWQAAVMWLAMVAFWGLVIWAVYALVSNLGRSHQPQHWHGLPEDARSILDQRLARGELSPEEYARLRETLETGRPRAPVG